MMKHVKDSLDSEMHFDSNADKLLSEATQWLDSFSSDLQSKHQEFLRKCKQDDEEFQALLLRISCNLEMH